MRQVTKKVMKGKASTFTVCVTELGGALKSQLNTNTWKTNLSPQEPICNVERVALIDFGFL